MIRKSTEHALKLIQITLTPALGLLLLVIGLPTKNHAQPFNRTFTVSPDASALEVVNQIGSIKVTASGANVNPAKIVINAKQDESSSLVNAVQTPDGQVKIEVKGRSAVDFDILVPPGTKLDLITYKGAISGFNLTGPLRARITTEGKIQFTGIRSSKVEAHSASGDVVFNGEILPNGEYTFKSFSGQVDATFPANSDFKLFASSFRGSMDLGDFSMKFDRKTNQLIEAACGAGRAKVSLWTHDGSIHLRRK